MASSSGTANCLVDAAAATATGTTAEGTATVPSSTNNSSSSYKTKSVAILIGPVAKDNTHTCPVVVWVCQTRLARDHQVDRWKHTLEYYEFLEDTKRWTHLDQLLLKFGTIHGNLHIGSSENLSGTSPIKSSKSSTNDKTVASNKQRRIQKLMESLQHFLDNREEDSDADSVNKDNSEMNEEGLPMTSCQMHLYVPIDPTKIESALSDVLLEDNDVQLAVRGNLQISRGLIQHGLSLWLYGEGLLKKGVEGGLENNEFYHSCKLHKGLLTSHLVMDRTAAQCIHLLPPPNAGVASVVGGTVHNNSLWGVLSKPCLTKIGKSKLNVWLRQPLINLERIMERQQAVADLRGLPKDSIRDALRAFTGFDISQLAQTLATFSAASAANNEDEESNNNVNNVLGFAASSPAPPTQSTKKSLQALYQLYLLASQKLPQLAEAASSSMVADTTTSELLKSTITELTKLVNELDRCSGLVEAVLDLDQAPREYMLKPTFAPELQELYNEMQDVQTSLEEEHEEMEALWLERSGDNGGGSTSKNSKVVRLETFGEDNTYQFRLPNTNDTKELQNIGNKIKVHKILKNGVTFSTLGLRQLSTKYQELQQEYTFKSKSVVKDAMTIAVTYETVVERCAEHLSTLDVLCSLAYQADFNPHGYCRPILTDTDDDGAGIQLEEARHPCVELQEEIEYIPNDISLVFGESNFLLVTGPNMGGKVRLSL